MPLFLSKCSIRRKDSFTLGCSQANLMSDKNVLPDPTRNQLREKLIVKANEPSYSLTDRTHEMGQWNCYQVNQERWSRDNNPPDFSVN